MIIELYGYKVDYRRKKIKNINLRISRDGRISLSVPLSVSTETAEKFFLSKTEWIDSVLKKTAIPDKIDEFKQGDSFYYFGEKLDIYYSDGKTCVDGDKFFVSPMKSVERACKYLSAELMKRAEKYLNYYSSLIGRYPSSVTVRKTTSRWGSCNKSTRRINLSFYLVSLPEKCLEYVVAHELCHLVYANHGEEFKALLTEIFPEWKKVRKFMRDSGKKYLINFG